MMSIRYRTERVSIDTAHGRIIAEIFTEQAPITAGNFLRYADEGHYAKAAFYRATRPDNDERSPSIQVLQGGMGPDCREAPLPPIAHEPTTVTGLSHVEGTLSVARWNPGSATSEFFIVLNDTPALDFGGERNPDKQGFAAFGRVVSGMDVVRTIHAIPTGSHPTIDFMKNQTLLPPVTMRIARL
jgi:peptidyl-prolyl cis-trans isomerase A (cyclophilin A)